MSRELSRKERAELDALAETHELSRAVAGSLVALATSIQRDTAFPDRWRDAVVPTISDALDAARHEVLRDAREIADIGKNGVLGLALAAVLPDAHVSFNEPRAKAEGIVRRAAAAMAATNVSLKLPGPNVDLVVARDMRLGSAQAIATNLLRPGGHVVLWLNEKEKAFGATSPLDRRLRPYPLDRGRASAIAAFELIGDQPSLDRYADHPEQQIFLEPGAHLSREEGMCATEAIAWLAGEQHTDRPACLSPALASFVRSLNDGLDDIERQRLLAYLPRLVDSNDDAREDSRCWLAVDWLIRRAAPVWLELATLDARASQLRDLPAITDPASLSAVRPALASAHGTALERRAEAIDGLLAAADPERSATMAAGLARASAGVFAAAAAHSASHATAGVAAETAAYVAADAARYGVFQAVYLARATNSELLRVAELAVSATSLQLQLSALDLIDELIDPPAQIPR